MGRPEHLPLPQQAQSLKKKSALKSYLSLVIPAALCTALYLTQPLSGLPDAIARWEGDVSLQNYDGASCPKQVEPLNVGLDWNPAEDVDYKTLAANRLIGAVQIVSPHFCPPLAAELR